MTDERESIEKMLPIRIISTVIRGFGRGASDLGIPTANVCPKSAQISANRSFDELPCGIYWGFCRIGASSSSEGAVTYKSAISIGFNPTYANESKTIEPHMIAPEGDPRRHISSCGETLLKDYYDEPIRLSVMGYLRPELPFEGLPKLIEAIKGDIVNADQLADGTDAGILTEKEWVQSDVIVG
jgi:FAD synthase